MLVNCIIQRDHNGHWAPQVSLLFWRALCETGVGLRFLLQPAFNLYVCHSVNCTRETGGMHHINIYSFMNHTLLTLYCIM